MTDYAVARFNMVEGQLKPNKVTNPALLDAMLSVPRDRFVPKAMRGIAHVDEDIPLGGGRFLMEPMILARLIETVDVRDNDIALVVGCGTGYAAAVMARLANTVVALESDRDLAQTATETLAHLGVDNAVVVEGPLAEGYPKQAPYQVIVFDGAVAEMPAAIGEQLADGGRMAAVLAPRGGMGKAALFQRIGSVVSHRPVFDAAVQLLPGCEPKPTFRF